MSLSWVTIDGTDYEVTEDVLRGLWLTILKSRKGGSEIVHMDDGKGASTILFLGPSTQVAVKTSTDLAKELGVTGDISDQVY